MVSLYAVQAAWPRSPCLHFLSAKIVGLSSPPSAPSSRFPRLGTSWEQTEPVGSWAADVSPCTYVFLTLLPWPEPSRAGGRQPFRILPAFVWFVLAAPSHIASVCCFFSTFPQRSQLGLPWVIVHRRSLQGCYRRKTSPREACC